MRFLVASLSLFVAFSASAKLNVVATLPVLADIAQKVGGDLVEVKSLAQPNQDPHFVIPVPTLMKKMRDADVFIENGLQLELWAQKLVDGSGNTRIQPGQRGHVVASKGIAMQEVPTELSRAQGDIHPGGNPHVWLDPENAKIIARNIVESYVRSDDKNKANYEAKLEAFKKEIDTRMAGWKTKANAVKNKSFITYHKSFIYFAKRFGFTIPMEIEEKPGIAPSARHRDELIALIKKDKIPAILMEPFYDPVPANFIAKETGARVIQAPIDVGAIPAAQDYFSLMDYLLNSLQN